MSKAEMTKEQRIKKEINRLKKKFQDLDFDTMAKVISLIENAAFMTITLEDLQKVMIEKGVVSEYQNGENQWGKKKSPEVEIYNTMIKNHMGIMKQLTDLTPEKPKKELKQEDAFTRILGRGTSG